jgi:arsenate reductase
MNTPRNVLFVGTTDDGLASSARELLERLSAGRIRAHSASPLSWDRYAGAGAPALDVVVTLSNSLIGEVCAVFWTGRPVTTHWPLPDDPEDARTRLAERIARFVALPFAELDPLSLQARLDAIGRA